MLSAGAISLGGCDALGGGEDGEEGPTEPVFESIPDTASCSAGRLTDAYQQGLIQRLNQIRAEHELPPVVLAEEEIEPAQQAALAIVANGDTSHHLSSSAFCYTAEAARSSEESLLFLSAGNQVGDISDPDRFLVEWLRDANVNGLGHRRWLLDPFVSQVAFGLAQGEPRVDFPYRPVAGAALHVIDHAEVDLTAWGVGFVAYPFGLYPAAFVDKDWLLSLSLVADASAHLASAERVSFATASVQVTAEQGASLGVRDLRASYDLTGLPNVLTWRVDGLADNTRYTVKVENVQVDGEDQDLEYEFTLVP